MLLFTRKKPDAYWNYRLRSVQPQEKRTIHVFLLTRLEKGGGTSAL